MNKDSHKTLNFTNLPLEAVTARRIFTEHIFFDIGIANKIWSATGAWFDTINDLTHIEVPPGGTFNTSFSGMLGFRCINLSLGIEVVVQQDSLIARWDRALQSEYCRYPKIIEALDAVTSAIEATISSQVNMHIVNITYDNELRRDRNEAGKETMIWPLAEGWFPNHGKKLGALRSYQLQYQGENSVEFNLELRNRPDDQSPHKYHLVTSAGSLVGDDDYKSVETTVHSQVVDWFISILSEEAKQAYGLLPHSE